MAELFWVYSNYAIGGLNDSTENKLTLIISKGDYKELLFPKEKKKEKYKVKCESEFSSVNRGLSKEVISPKLILFLYPATCKGEDELIM